jgi:hypothetical protein
MEWQVAPEPRDADERQALEQAAADALAGAEVESRWWRSGFDDLGGGAAAEQPWRDPGVVQA